MKVIVTGTMDVELMARKLIEIADNTIAKLKEEQDINITGYKVHEAEVTVKFDIEGAK